jgi:DNA-binding GntR family transcriptional regulator
MAVENIVPREEAGVSRAESAYRAIRDAILSGKLSIAEHLPEELIAQQLNMSRTPVREALGRLHTEGLVREAKPRGYVVSAVTATDVFHVYAVRQELEGFCLRLAAARVTAHQLFQLSTIQDRMERAIDKPETFSRLNREFHEIIVNAADNPVLAKIMDDLMAVVERFPVSAYRLEGRAAQALIEHQTILDALSCHDPQAAEVTIREHLTLGLEARLAALRQHELNQPLRDCEDS